MKYRKKPIVIDADQWFKNGDHPFDGDDGEGKIVRYFRQPNVPGSNVCEQCGHAWREHGWIDTLEGGLIVCVGDFIIQGIEGEFYSCKPDIFAKTYEMADTSIQRKSTIFIAPIEQPFTYYRTGDYFPPQDTTTITWGTKTMLPKKSTT